MAPAGASGTAADPVTLEDVVARVRQEGVRYALVGEHHGVGPVKRFAVDLANALVDCGEDVGLYVEGFRTGCEPRDEGCSSISRVFNRGAFLSLLDNSRAPVHPLDPPGGVDRAARMAELIAAGPESIKIVLVGSSHVVFAGDPGAVHPVFGGEVLYPDPGDVAEAFPRHEILTFVLECREDAGGPYLLRPGGSGADYLLSTKLTGQY